MRVQKFSDEEGGKKKGAWNPKMWPLLDKDDFEQCCRRAFLETNKALHDEEAVSAVLLRDTRVELFVAVVGFEKRVDITVIPIHFFPFCHFRNMMCIMYE
jgi:hypothetical protein